MTISLLFKVFLFFQLADAGLVSRNPIVDAVYGDDDRIFVDATMEVSKISQLSNSVAMIVSRDYGKKKSKYTNFFASLLSHPDGLNVCPDEKFANHHTLNNCTGFLVGSDLVVSAGHCFQTQDDCDRNLIAFNVRVSNETESGYSILNKNIYECREIISNASSEGGPDYSVIRLKTKVLDRLPLKLRTKGEISLGESVFMIGHPLGLPLTYSPNAQVNDISNPDFFKGTLESFEGNSGSPVFNSKTLLVEGILVSGNDDFILDPAKECLRNTIYEQNSKGSSLPLGEGVYRIKNIFPFIK